MKRKRLNISVHSWLILVISLLLLLPLNQALAQDPNLIKNGDFEDGFVAGLDVANEWGHFSSGNVAAGFHDDAWDLVVFEGEHSQMIELINATTLDTYGGIYQNVAVTPGQSYQFSFKGLVRSDEGSPEASNYGYRMQYAIDLSGNQDWQQVTEWVELPWDDQPRTGPASGAGFNFESVETTFTAGGDSVTVFIRAWKKWVGAEEGNYNIDAVRLVPVEAPAETATPEPTATPPPTATPEPVTEPLPETGSTETGAGNTIWVTASAVIILLLLGRALINQRKRITR